MSASSTVEPTVLEILGDVLSETPDDLYAEPVLAAHGWDSIASLEALAQLEDRLQITLDLRSFHAAHTVPDLVALVTETVVADKARIP